MVNKENTSGELVTMVTKRSFCSSHKYTVRNLKEKKKCYSQEMNKFVKKKKLPLTLQLSAVHFFPRSGNSMVQMRSKKNKKEIIIKEKENRNLFPFRANLIKKQPRAVSLYTVS